MGVWSNFAIGRPVITKPAVVSRMMVTKGLQTWGLTVTRLSRLTRMQRIVVLELAERIRVAAKKDTMTLITPNMPVLESLARFLVQEIFPGEALDGMSEPQPLMAKKVSEIPVAVIESLRNSEAVSLGKKEIDFGKLDSVLRANAGRFVPPPQS